MASPQVENGYTRIANELLEALYRARLAGSEWGLIMCIARASYGWNQKAAPISIRKAAKRLGKHYAHVKRTARDLMDRRILCRQNGRIMIMKDYEQWGPKTVPGAKDGPGDQGCTQEGTNGAPIEGTNLVPTLPGNLTPAKAPQVRKESSKAITKENKALTLAAYTAQLSREDQDIIHRTVQAIASTRKSGKVAGSILDVQARKWSHYSAVVVLRACQVYLDRQYATEHKREEYLLGIIRQEAKRTNGHGGNAANGQRQERLSGSHSSPKTPGRIAIDRAAAAMRAEQEPAR